MRANVIVVILVVPVVYQLVHIAVRLRRLEKELKHLQGTLQVSA